MTEDLKDPPLVVGVCLASTASGGETTTQLHPLATITVSPSLFRRPLTELRPLVTSSLPLSLRSRAFSFLSQHGWELAPATETSVNVSQVFQDHTHSIVIQLSQSQPRIGLVAEGSPPVPLGFISCEVGIPLPQLHGEIQRQLPSLYSTLVATGYSLLDNNGWPIGRHQETEFSLAEVLSHMTVRLRLHPHQPDVSMVTSTGTSQLAILPGPAHSSDSTHNEGDSAHPLRPVVEESADMAESSLLDQSMSSYTAAISIAPGTTPYEILLSYVHREASDEAVALREALQVAGYRVFLDVECIRGGSDWQDVLNDAVSNCTVFVPLITEQYGQTLWTNREVKLADVLEKAIIPVNFLSRWPPQCLAIQFATTQFVSWPHSTTSREWNEDTVARVAKEIVDRYTEEVGGEVEEKEEGGMIADDGGCEEEEEVEEGEGERMELGAEERRKSFTRADTKIIVEDEEEEEEGLGLLSLPQLSRQHRKSTIKSYASLLPSSLPLQYRKSIQESRMGKPLVVISCHIAQQEFARSIAADMEGRGFEAWCSCDILHLPPENASPVFQLRANEAGVVIFIFSKEFTENTFCENQVYYCEQRKRIIPVIYEPIQLPHWVSMLIGTSPFISCQSSGHRQQLLDRVDEAVNPQLREVSLRSMLNEKAEISRLCTEVTKKLPSGRSLVYISGGTKFYSEKGEEICRQLGLRLAQESNVALVTGGFYGVGETVGRSFNEERGRRGQGSGVWHLIAERDKEDRSNQTRQNKDGSFPAVPYGQTIFAGSSVRQREMITPHVVRVCILIEGGPGAAFEAQQFSWNGNYIIPVKVTGGAAGGLFNVPQSIFQRPPAIDESDWSVLGNSEVTCSEIAAAVVRIIRTLNFEPAVCGRRRVEVGGAIQRSETLPQQTPPTNRKRTFSDSRRLQPKLRPGTSSLS